MSEVPVYHLGDDIRANSTSQQWTHPRMSPDSGGIPRRCPLVGGAICPHVVSRVDTEWMRSLARMRKTHDSMTETELTEIGIPLKEGGIALKEGSIPHLTECIY